MSVHTLPAKIDRLYLKWPFHCHRRIHQALGYRVPGHGRSRQPDGKPIWSRLLGGPLEDYAYVSAVGPKGELYVAGRAGSELVVEGQECRPFV